MGLARFILATGLLHGFIMGCHDDTKEVVDNGPAVVPGISNIWLSSKGGTWNLGEEMRSTDGSLVFISGAEYPSETPVENPIVGVAGGDQLLLKVEREGLHFLYRGTFEGTFNITLYGTQDTIYLGRTNDDQARTSRRIVNP